MTSTGIVMKSAQRNSAGRFFTCLDWRTILTSTCIHTPYVTYGLHTFLFRRRTSMLGQEFDNVACTQTDNKSLRTPVISKQQVSGTAQQCFRQVFAERLFLCSNEWNYMIQENWETWPGYTTVMLRSPSSSQGRLSLDLPQHLTIASEEHSKSVHARDVDQSTWQGLWGRCCKHHHASRSCKTFTHTDICPHIQTLSMC